MKTNYLTPKPFHRSHHHLEDDDFIFIAEGDTPRAHKGRIFREFLEVIRSVPDEVSRSNCQMLWERSH